MGANGHVVYVTADKIGQENHGAGSVTLWESRGLRKWSIQENLVDNYNLDREWFSMFLKEEERATNNPFMYDDVMMIGACKYQEPRLFHFYAGTFSNSIEVLKQKGCKIVYTAAAHDIKASITAHKVMGVPYNYPHITDPEQWMRYIKGYLLADLVICPSTHSKEVMEGFGCKNVIVIPHGISSMQFAAPIKPPPKGFRVGYLGNCGAPDKGLVHLLRAWRHLEYKDATLCIAGHDSSSPWVRHLVGNYGGGNIELCGWQENINDFYDSLSVYVQPSVTEGFGIEVLEAMSRGRHVVCSKGAGASDLVCPEFGRVVIDNLNPLKWAEAIDHYMNSPDRLVVNQEAIKKATEYVWPSEIVPKYVAAYDSLKGESK